AWTQRVVQDDDEAVDVKEREDAERNLVLTGEEVRLDLTEVRDEIAVREQHALREAGRAARVRQGDDVIRLDRHIRRVVGRLEQPGERPLSDDEDVFDLRRSARGPRLLPQHPN